MCTGKQAVVTLVCVHSLICFWKMTIDIYSMYLLRYCTNKQLHVIFHFLSTFKDLLNSNMKMEISHVDANRYIIQHVTWAFGLGSPESYVVEQMLVMRESDRTLIPQ